MTRGRSIVDSKLSGGKIIFTSGVPSSLHTSIPLVAPYSIDVKYLTVCGGIWNMLSFMSRSITSSVSWYTASVSIFITGFSFCVYVNDITH